MKTTDAVHELFLNYACNAKCAFCYNPPITPELLRRELSLEQAAASLYRAAKGGARRLNLHGGEPTLRDDLPTLLALARRLGFAEITLVTNGVRLASSRYVRKLASSGLTTARLSVHGPDAETHDKIVEIPGAFDRILQALEHLRAAKVPAGLNFVMVRRNLRTLPDFLERFVATLGVDDVIVYFPHLRGMMALNAATEALTYEEAAPFVSDGLARLGPAAASVLLANFPPCALPEHAGRMLDWAHDEGAPALQVHPEGFSEELEGMKDAQRAPVPACAECSMEKECRGVEREYVERFGGAAFRPIPARRAA
jgi:MoaA/NifB/PqqE/SkfB family radical SAM enzyme